jgi:hypothetical protein
MITTKISVTAQAGFNHPFEQYSNFKPSVSIEALIEPGEDADTALRALQHKAQRFCDDEKARILAACQLEQDIENAESEVQRWTSIVASYENTLATALAWLDAHPKAAGESWGVECNRDDKIRALTEAQGGIEEARQKLAEARTKLDALRAQ